MLICLKNTTDADGHHTDQKGNPFFNRAVRGTFLDEPASSRQTTWRDDQDGQQQQQDSQPQVD